MVGSFFRKRLIPRRDAAFFLGDLLKTAFCVLVGTFRDDLVYFAVQILRDERLGTFVAGIQIDRANDRLKRICEYRLARTPDILRLAAGEQEIVAHAKRLPERGEIATPVQEQLIVELYSK